MPKQNEHGEWEYTPAESAGIADWYVAQQSKPTPSTEPPKPPPSPMIVEMAGYMGVSPDEYQALVDARIAERQTPPARNANGLTDEQRSAARAAGWTDAEYLAKWNEIQKSKGR